MTSAAGLALAIAAGAAAQDSGSTATDDAGLSAAGLEHLVDVTHGWVDDGRLAGLATLIAHDGEVVLLDTYGMANIAENRPISQDTIFHLYSMTKPITSVALLMLYEEGKFELDDPLAEHLPELADLKVFAGVDADGKMILEEAHRQPTVEDVFRHTAGFSYGPFGDGPVDMAYREANLFGGSLEDLVSKVGDLPLQYHPGERWVYSVSHDVQGRLVEVLSGKSLDAFMQERIFDPLGMEDTQFRMPAELIDRYAVIYGAGENGSGLQPSGDVGSSERGNGVWGGTSLAATITDYATFAQMLLDGGEANGVRLLRPETVELMTTNHLPEGVTRGRSAGEAYGLGVRVVTSADEDGRPSPGTFGWSGLASTYFFVDPEKDIVAILMTQKMPTDGRAGAEFEALVYDAIAASP
jgi:CubicO group peptidase (beta-lactamase class C family)